MHAGMKTPEQFTPTDADFCIITFRLLPSPFLNRASREKRNTAVWNVTEEAAGNGQVGQKGATTFVAPRLDRSRSWYNSIGQTLLDVTDNIYIGARPGHNQQAEDSPHTRHTSHSHRHTSSFLDARRSALSRTAQHICFIPNLPAQDMMVPFDQLGIEHSPADFFNASTASYAPDV